MHYLGAHATNRPGFEILKATTSPAAQLSYVWTLFRLAIEFSRFRSDQLFRTKINSVCLYERVQLSNVSLHRTKISIPNLQIPTKSIARLKLPVSLGSLGT